MVKKLVQQFLLRIYNGPHGVNFTAKFLSTMHEMPHVLPRFVRFRPQKNKLSILNIFSYSITILF